MKAGEEVVVTDHGRPVAKLVPAFDADEHLRELERRGLVRIGSGKLPPGFFDLPRPAPAKSVLEALIDERRHGR